MERGQQTSRSSHEEHRPEPVLAPKAKQLIAVAVAPVTQRPYCIRGHTSAVLQQEATAEEIMEAIWVAAELRAGGAYAHSTLAPDTIARAKNEKNGQSQIPCSPRRDCGFQRAS